MREIPPVLPNDALHLLLAWAALSALMLIVGIGLVWAGGAVIRLAFAAGAMLTGWGL